ncbi:hypothetical protein [Veronia pacifica]|uniref:Uncharacterized protein n=2 Tax=Veronia pacifica TaxID=1080227 RepID=A0A1C3E9G3_9GAMM|nr:hypothetical protein A8L45_21460 [Veronia pacifica]
MIFDFSNLDTKLLIAIIAPISACIGYSYRARTESKKKQKRALYLMLEVWHRLSVNYKKDFRPEFIYLFKKIENKIPDLKLSEDDINIMYDTFEPVLLEKMKGISQEDLEDYQNKFKEAIILTSEDNPILAYEISHSVLISKISDDVNSMFSKFLGNNTSQEENERKLRRLVESIFDVKAIESLEDDVKKVARSISIFDFIRVKNKIKKRKNFLLNSHKADPEIERLASSFLDGVKMLSEDSNKKHKAEAEI